MNTDGVENPQGIGLEEHAEHGGGGRVGRTRAQRWCVEGNVSTWCFLLRLL